MVCYAKKMSGDNDGRDYLCMSIMGGLILIRNSSNL